MMQSQNHTDAHIDQATPDASPGRSRDLIVMAAVVALVALLALPFYVRTMRIEMLNGQFWLALCGFGGNSIAGKAPASSDR